MAIDMKNQLDRIPLEVFNQGNFGLIDDLVSRDFVEHQEQPGLPRTREGFKRGAMALKTAFPDLHYTIEETIEIGDTIVHRLCASGTMTGAYSGMPATGKRTTWTEIHIGRVAGGRLVEHWGLVAPGEVPVAA